MQQKQWGDKPYHSFDYACKQTYGRKVYKLSLNGGFTCPNRDGFIDNRGCIFCSAGGSGEFAGRAAQPIASQLAFAKSLVAGKLKKPETAAYIAYFQAFTGTYAPLHVLQKQYEAALADTQVVGLAVATRPDCLPEEILNYLMELNQHIPVTIELGLQTISDKIADYIRRGYPLSTFEQAVMHLSQRNIPVVVHIIIGLPGETKELLLDTIHYLNRLPIQGVKLSLLHVLKGTDLAKEYERYPEHFPDYSMEQYCRLVGELLEELRPDIVVHRLTGDGAKSLLIAPLWTANKRLTLNTMMRILKEQHSYQGKKYKEETNGK